ncbi:uncharacterized protein LOC128988081 [Macrosteles quadrilineatus]|uniref:uncharacterized protein LOC128988081 n=1 Tax=Macrosteles quadrilineatus TaxID=74068 RepID=UPI0023E0CEC3|nr:uncharacterized protein LOC128988081 [Macrosteles quadrilineatus]
MSSRLAFMALRSLLRSRNQLALLRQVQVADSSSLASKPVLLPRSQQPFTIHKSLEMTQATTLSPTDVHLRGPCPPPPLKCPPPPCACPPPPEVVTMGQRMVRLMWFLTKLGVYLAVVKFTIDEGLWGNSQETEQLAQRIGLLSQATGEDSKEAKEGQDGKGSSSSPKVLWNKLVLKVGEVIGLKP